MIIADKYDDFIRDELSRLAISQLNKPYKHGSHGFDNFEINQGDRIAQLVVCKVEQIVWNVVDVLDETDRGAGGFGSTKVQ